MGTTERVFYQLAIPGAQIPLEKPIQLGKNRYAFSLKNNLSVFSQIYRLIQQDLLLPTNLALVVGALQAARPSVQKGGSWLETRVALVPVVVRLQNTFHKASSLVLVVKGPREMTLNREGPGG